MPSFNTAFMTSFRQRHLEDDIDDAATPFPTLSAEPPSRSSSSATLSSSSSTVSSHYREQELQKENEPNHVRLRRILDSAGGYDSMYPGSRKRRRVQSMPHDADRFVAGPSEGDARILFNAWRPSKKDPAQSTSHPPSLPPMQMHNLPGNSRQALLRYNVVLASSFSNPIIAEPPHADTLHDPRTNGALAERRPRVRSYFAVDGPAERARDHGATADVATGSVSSLRMRRSGGLKEDTENKLLAKSRVLREISTTAYKVLDAPDLEDDFYLTLVDWSVQNAIAVALGKSIYTYSVESGKVEMLHTCRTRGPDSRDLSASLRFFDEGKKLAVGDKRGFLTLFDVEAKKKLVTISGHHGRMGSMSVMGNLIATGSADHNIIVRDVRDPLNPVKVIPAHSAEVCGLQFSAYNEPVLASGGDDCKLYIWDLRSASSSSSSSGSRSSSATASPALLPGRLTSDSMISSVPPGAAGFGSGSADGSVSGSSRWNDRSGGKTAPMFKLTDHRAAVKALAWSPHHRGLLASGGGRQDPMIRFWNTTSGVRIDSLQCTSQITNLAWSTTSDEIVSTHGYGQYTGPGLIQIWHYPSRTSNVSFAAHSGRVLYLATSPNGQSIATASSDQTLRFFSVFPERPKEVNEMGKDVLGRIR